MLKTLIESQSTICFQVYRLLCPSASVRTEFAERHSLIGTPVFLMPPRDLSASSSFFLCKDKLPLSHDLIILWELVNELIDFTVIIGSQRKDNIADM